MDFDVLIGSFITYIQGHQLLALVAGVLILLLLYRRPKLTVTLLGIAVVLVGILIFISNLSSIGISHKANMVTTRPAPGQ